VIPQGGPAYVDHGEQGMHKDDPDIDARLPVKLLRGKNDLTRSENIFTTNPCRVSMRIENSLAHVKKFQVLSQPYRHSLHHDNPPCRFVANTVNVRMRQRSNAPRSTRESALWHSTVASRVMLQKVFSRTPIPPNVMKTYAQMRAGAVDVQ
jgi:hypothetical protein